MNLGELCQFLESKLDPENEALTLREIGAESVIPQSIEQGPRIVFAVDSLDLTVMEVLKAARKYIGKGKAPVVLTVCACDFGDLSGILDDDDWPDLNMDFPDIKNAAEDHLGNSQAPEEDSDG